MFNPKNDLNPQSVLILGCGFTGKRVANRLVKMGIRVIATSRNPSSLMLEHVQKVAFDVLKPDDLGSITTLVDTCEAVVCSIPTLRVEGDLIERVPAIADRLAGRARRFVYLSTTGVYGRQKMIDEHSRPAATTKRELLRVEAEDAVLAAFPQGIVLRPAAIYGPGRGVHVSIREGRYRLTGDGENYISRIHVDDLAAQVVAALGSDLSGAWPVADEHPCSQREMAEFCADLLGLPMPPASDPNRASETLRANRRVDGSAVRRRLGIELRYPSYREGVPASLREEMRSAGLLS
ncbi:MAG: NAD(P)H-binding protein [Bryobacterales bacterium]|nr:NAD(P)H-binding protein [Bryobacterales bacterium]